jgi:hypothetical protein
MKIYDCFLFFNELDLLELRLREHYDHVDHFVIGESNLSFTGQPKPYHLLDNWERFQPWADKIIRVEITDLDPSAPDAWRNEAQSRENLLRGLDTAEPNDIIFLSDCDEILRDTTWQRMRESTAREFGFRMPMFYFRLNYMQTHPTKWWEGGSAVRKGLLDQGIEALKTRNEPWGPMEYLRRSRHSIGVSEMSVITHAGWHFGWLGDDQAARNKLANFAHQELNRPDLLEKLDLELSISRGRGLFADAPDTADQHVTVAVDDYFPRAVLVDRPRWEQYIIPGEHASVRNHLRF